nr:hypothetical protein [Streptomyces sp. NRRL B-24572]
MTSVELMFSDAVRSLRRHGLVTAGRYRGLRGWPVLHDYSELVVPRPQDWPTGPEVSGHWWPHETGQPSRELEDFLAAGPRPVSVGLGSATVPEPERVSREMVTALRAANVRGIVQRRWAGPDARGDDTLTVDEVPHSLLSRGRPPPSTTRERARPAPSRGPGRPTFRCRSSSTRRSGRPG